MAGLTVNNLAFGIASQAKGFSNSADGLMGLGYQSLSTINQKSFIWQWYSSGQLLSPVFCFWLGPYVSYCFISFYYIAHT